VGPTASGRCEEEKISCPYQEWISDSSVVVPVIYRMNTPGSLLEYKGRTDRHVRLQRPSGHNLSHENDASGSLMYSSACFTNKTKEYQRDRIKSGLSLI
jgi:hypothetical protein